MQYLKETFGTNPSIKVKKIVEEFRKFFTKNKKPEETSIIDITNIATMKVNLKLQSIYNPTLAKSMREEVIREFE